MLRYTYDIDDNLTAMDYSDTGSKVRGLRFTYNQYKWLTEVRADTGGLLDEKVRDYVYGDDGKLLQIKDYKGVLSGGLGYVQLHLRCLCAPSGHGKVRPLSLPRKTYIMETDM